MSRTSRSAAAITRDYENWMKSQLPFVMKKHLRYKHDRMAGNDGSDSKKAAPDAFAFLRATFYLWGVRVQEHLGDLVARDVPRVWAIGDVHLENFGTWRDAEGRLVWGANDMDEASRMPYTNDLVRLATSAALGGLEIGEVEIAAEVIRGYRDALRNDPLPFVLAERNQRLAALALKPKVDPKQWWDDKFEEHDRLSRRRQESVKAAVRALYRSFPDQRFDDISVGTRRAGLGSLGRPRIVALGKWRGSLICREAKALLPSAWDWSHGHPGRVGRTGALLASPCRATDPYAKIVGPWSVRRLAPDSDKIDITTIRALDQTRLLRAMGRELGNVHVAHADADGLLGHLPKGSDWLLNAARIMADVVRTDQRQYAQTHRTGHE